MSKLIATGVPMIIESIPQVQLINASVNKRCAICGKWKKITGSKAPVVYCGAKCARIGTKARISKFFNRHFTLEKFKKEEKEKRKQNSLEMIL